MDLHYMRCFRGEYAMGHVYDLKTRRTLCGRNVRLRRGWHNDGPLRPDDEPNCKVCARALRKREEK